MAPASKVAIITGSSSVQVSVQSARCPFPGLVITLQLIIRVMRMVPRKQLIFAENLEMGRLFFTRMSRTTPSVDGWQKPLWINGEELTL